MEVLNLVAADDPVTVARHAEEHDMLDTNGWKRLRGCIGEQCALQPAQLFRITILFAVRAQRTALARYKKQKPAHSCLSISFFSTTIMVDITVNENFIDSVVIHFT